MSRKQEEDKEGLQYYRLLQSIRPLIAKILYRFAFSNADIDDISQETLLRALEAKQKADIRHPRQFMISIAKNVAREEARRRARTTTELIEDSVLDNHSLDAPSAEAQLDSRHKLRLFTQAISNLPPQCRKVFVLKHVHGASHKAIAARLGISVSTVEKHVAAGLKACRREMLEALNKGNTESEIRHLFEANRNSESY